MPYKTKEQRAKRDQARRLENLEFLVAYKLKSGCVDCGYNKHHAGLQFDHLPGFKKYANVASLTYRSREVLLEEISKCEVVCGTCHCIRTFERGQFSGK